MASENNLPTGLLVSAQTLVAAQSGIPIVVRKRGDNDSGTVFLKVSTLDGFARVFSQISDGDTQAWICATGEAAVTESEADAYLNNQSSFDPDAWLIEVEDKQGRLWFPGKIVKM